MSQNVSQMLVYLLGLITVFLGYNYQNVLVRKNELVKQLSEKRYEAYKDFIEYFFDFYKDFKFNKKDRNDIQNKKAIDEWSKKLIDVQAKMMIYSNDRIMKLFVAWRKQSESVNENNRSLSIFYIIKIIIEVRKDMGNKLTLVSEKDIMALLSQDYEEIMAIRPRTLPEDVD